MRKFRMVHETPSHYIMHNGDDHFHIAKEGLTPDLHTKIKALKGQNIVMEGNKMSDGGEVASNEYILERDGNMRRKTQAEIDASPKKHLREPASTEDIGKMPAAGSRTEELRKNAFHFSGGGEVPNDLSRDEAATKQEHEQNAAHLKRELSVPYADYGTNEDTPPPSIVYNFFHGHAPARKVQSFATGGMALDEKAGMDPTEMQRAEDVARLAPTPEPSTLTSDELASIAPGMNRTSSGLPSELQGTPPSSLGDVGSTLKNAANQAFAPQAPAPLQGLPTTTISPAEQVSFASSPIKPVAYSDGPLNTATSGEFPNGGLPQFQQGENETRRGIDMSAKAQSEAAQETLNANKDFAEAQAKREQAFQEEMKALEAEQQSLRSDILSKKIDPEHYWNSQSTASKITTTLSLIFGGLGSGLTHQPSEAAAMLERAVKDDIDSQKEDRSTKMNLYKEGLEKFRDKQLAENYATIRAHTVLEAQIQQAAAKLGTKQAYALAQQAKGELDRNDAPKKLELGMAGAKLKALNDITSGSANYTSGSEKETAKDLSPDTPFAAPSSPGADLANLSARIQVARMNNLITPEEEAKANQEIQEYASRKDDINTYRAAFDKMANNKNFTEGALPGFLPTLKKNSLDYEAAKGPLKDTFTRENAGRVTPISLDQFDPFLPKYLHDKESMFNNYDQGADMIKGHHKYPATLVGKGYLSPNDPYLKAASTRQAENRGKFSFKPTPK